jgi:hypothetical protein
VCAAAAPPTRIFFPDDQEAADVDALMAEAVSEADTGYRPNVSAYAPAATDEAAPSATARPVIALENMSIFTGTPASYNLDARVLTSTYRPRRAVRVQARALASP